MNSTSESLSPLKPVPERAAGGNCVAARRGGEQPEADPQSQTKVNSIRPVAVASLLRNGEACVSNPASAHRPVKHDAGAADGVWSGNAGKDSCVSGETCRIQDTGNFGQLELFVPAGVRAAIVAEKPGNSGGAKGGRKVNASSEGSCEQTPATVPETDKQAGEDLWHRYKAKRGIWSEKMLMALERGVKGNKWFSLIDKVGQMDTLELAWKKVQSNAGACGVDGITVKRFSKDSQTRLLAVKEHLKNGTYQPKPVKRVWIPKVGSKEKRPLGIPTVTDRVVQQATRMVIEPIFEASFSEHSYGFRPGRGCKDALREVETRAKSGLCHVVEVDIKGYFDAVPHDRLLAKVADRIADGRILKLIKSFLEAGVMEEIEFDANDSGTPQGGVISPLLANIYLNDLDWQMERSGFAMTRYADDMVILCANQQDAERALEEVRKWMEAAGLQLHPEKTRIVDMTIPRAYFDFLGYRFERSLKGRLSRLVRPKSWQKFRDELRCLTRRNNPLSMEQNIQRLNPKLKGWYHYFKQASKRQHQRQDSWLRHRLRSILRRRHRRRGRETMREHLQYPNCYFTQLGLFSLEQAKIGDLISLRNGVKH